MHRRKFSISSFSAANEPGLVGVLDIGASKVSCFIAYLMPDAVDGQDTEIIGVGHHASSSIGEGGLVELATDTSVRAAIGKAERMASKKLTSWHVAVSGRHVACRRLAADLDLGGHAVMEEDLADCYQEGAAFATAEKMTPLHIWPSSFSIDGLDDVRDPRGLVGDQLSVFLVGLSASQTAIANIINCLDRCHVSAASFIAAPYAASLAVLREEEKSLGVLCLDMGANLTGFTVYKDGHLVFAGAVPLGSNHITQDIAQIFNLGTASAERAKTVFGTGYCAPGDDNRYVDVAERIENKQVSVASLAEVIGPRLEEIFSLVTQSIANAGFDPALLRRIVITGGGSQLQGICELVENLQDAKVRIGRPLNIFGAPEAVSGSAFAVCAGMIRHLVVESESQSYNIPRFLAAATTNASHAAATSATNPLYKAAGWLRDRF